MVTTGLNWFRWESYWGVAHFLGTVQVRGKNGFWCSHWLHSTAWHNRTEHRQFTALRIDAFDCARPWLDVKVWAKTEEIRMKLQKKVCKICINNQNHKNAEHGTDKNCSLQPWFDITVKNHRIRVRLGPIIQQYFVRYKREFVITEFDWIYKYLKSSKSEIYCNLDKNIHLCGWVKWLLKFPWEFWESCSFLRCWLSSWEVIFHGGLNFLSSRWNSVLIGVLMRESEGADTWSLCFCLFRTARSKNDLGASPGLTVASSWIPRKRNWIFICDIFQIIYECHAI